MEIQFTSTRQEATFYSPLEDFEETTIPVDVREDPLTGRQTRIVPESFLVAEDSNIEPAIGDGEVCFFCPDSVSEVTPEYPDYVGMDRGSVGEATSFPNLNPYGSHSNVVVLTEDHFVPIGEFDSETFADGFEAAMEYLSAVFAGSEETTVGSINMNFLPSAGSSIVHPHIQTLVDDRGTNHQRRRLEARREYFDDTGSAFDEAILDAERDGERYVGRTGDVEWYAPFAPRHQYHVRGVLESASIPAADATVLEDLAAGVTNVLGYYDDLGLNSFNFGFQVVADEPAARPVIDVVARSVFDEYYWSDATFFETIHDEAVIDEAPEAYASDVATFF